MGKIAYNNCYGSFSLSYKATLRYVELAKIDFDENIMSDPQRISWDLRNIGRADPFLIQVIEELGKEANGNAADLRICELPSGTKYRVDDYDGKEKVMTPDDYTWETVP